MKKCPACNTDCIALVGGDGIEHLCHTTGPDGNFPACPVLSGEMAKAQERAQATVPVESMSALLTELESAKKHNDRLKTKVGKYLGELDSASDAATTFRADWERALEMRDEARAEAEEYKVSARDLAAAYEKASRERDEARAEVERLRAHTKAHEDWEAQMRPALDALIESLPYDCAGPVPPGCGGTCPPCRVQILLA